MPDEPKPAEELPLDDDERALIGLPGRKSPIAPDFPPNEWSET